MSVAKGTISILGCGWLGLPLAEHLLEQGYHVKGSTTTEAKLERLAAAGIRPYLLTLDPWLHGEQVRDFFDADALFLNVPPGRGNPQVEQDFHDMTEAVRTELHYSPIHFVLFASSTSVYPDLNCTVVETDARRPESASGRALLEAEKRLLADSHFDTTVLRFGGLYGGDRHPGRFLAGRKQLANGAAPVNLIHRDDSIGLVSAILNQDVRGEVFNACADAHPTREVLYTRAAEKLGLAPPHFADEPMGNFKVVSNAKVKRWLGYRFLHPDPLQDLQGL